MKRYLRPSIIVLNEQVFFNGNAQYIVNITDQYCHGDACGEPLTVEFASGTDLYMDDCIGSGEDPTGEYQDIKCLEIGDQVYRQVVADYTYGGSDQCGIGETPVIIHWTFNPSLPPVCTITAEVNEEGVDECKQSCK